MSDTLSVGGLETMRPAAVEVPEISERSELHRLLVSLVAFVAAFDFLLFDSVPGISVTLFGFAALAFLAWRRGTVEWSRPRLVLWSLTAVALLQSAVELNFPNAACLFALFAVVMMEHKAEALGFQAASLWIAPLTCLAGIGRWFMFAESLWHHASAWGRPESPRRWVTWLRVLVPSTLAILPVLLLVASGNSLIAGDLNTILDVARQVFHRIALPGPVRVFSWFFTGTAALVFFQPQVFASVGRMLLRPWLPRPAGEAGTLSHARTVTTLAMANLVFLWANATDIQYLWFRAELPPGTYYSAYVHEGVFSLVLAALFSAGVFTFLFQKDISLRERPLPRWLVGACMAQALILVVSVALRLKLYIDEYQLTVLRCYVLLFLAAMTTGFGLLTYKIFKAKSMNWLCQANALVCFSILFVFQFVDLEGFIARYNTREYLRGAPSVFNVSYLELLGTSALPSLRQLETKAPAPEIRAEAFVILERAEKAWTNSQKLTWRSWQARSYALQKACFAAPPLKP